ncbi:MAG TPA: allantoinase AllB [Thermoanaerobaculia bacterium]|nr:allantoinase AllB [Thermoanaerobaculia bacterium]
MSALVVRGRRVVTPEGVRPASVHVAGGVIVAVAAYDDAGPSGAPRLEAGELLVMPGLLDTHVHVDEPGRTEWEGFRTATRAAAAGGVTTLVDMPLNSIPATTSVAAFQVKLAAAAGQLAVDVGFWGGVVPGNAGELRGLAEAGVFGYKCFLVPSGVAEFAAVTEADLRMAAPLLAELGLPLLAHAELPGPIAAVEAALAGASPRSHATWLASRPPAAEGEAVALLLRLARDYGLQVHVVHVSAREVLSPLRAARELGLPVTAETCPHYLTFAAEEIPDGATTFKCAPPIRERANNEALWRALEAGDLDLVASDHSPCPPAMKELTTGDFFRAWGGIASLELGLAAVWSGARRRGIAAEKLAQWMAAAPAALAGLAGRKGALAPGHDADLVLWDPEATFRVDPAALRQRHLLTPYAGRELHGVVVTTILRGEVVYDGGQLRGEPRGRILRR